MNYRHVNGREPLQPMTLAAIKKIVNIAWGHDGILSMLPQKMNAWGHLIFSDQGRRSKYVKS